MDCALLCAGSSFTVGVAEEERDTASVTEMADAPKCIHKMAKATTHHFFSVNRHEPSHISADHPESGHVTADLPEPCHVTADRHESSHISTDLAESLLISTGHPDSHHVTTNHPDSSSDTGNLHESSHVSTDRHEASHVSADPPESLHVSADPPESLHVSADPPESLHVSADLPESLHVSADPPESLHIFADPPEPLHVTADHPESLHITADQPESCHVLSAIPIFSRLVLQYPSLVSSVRDAPLVSAHAAGIPKSAHFNPQVPVLIPLSEALPMIGIALCCVWAAYTWAVQRHDWSSTSPKEPILHLSLSPCTGYQLQLASSSRHWCLHIEQPQAQHPPTSTHYYEFTSPPEVWDLLVSDASWYHHREAQNHSPEHSLSPFLAGGMIFPPPSGMLDPCQFSSNNWKLNFHFFKIFIFLFILLSFPC